MRRPGISSPEGPSSASWWCVATVVARPCCKASSPWPEPSPWKAAVCGADAWSVCSLCAHLRGRERKSNITKRNKIKIVLGDIKKWIKLHFDTEVVLHYITMLLLFSSVHWVGALYPILDALNSCQCSGLITQCVIKAFCRGMFSAAQSMLHSGVCCCTTHTTFWCVAGSHIIHVPSRSLTVEIIVRLQE